MVLWALNFLSRMIMVISQNNPWLRCSFSDLSTATEYSVSVADINFRLGISMKRNQKIGEKVESVLMYCIYALNYTCVILSIIPLGILLQLSM